MKKRTALLYASLMTACTMFADIPVCSDSTMYYVEPPHEDIITISLKQQVSLPTGITDAQKFRLLSIIENITGTKHLVDMLVYDQDKGFSLSSEAHPMNNKVMSKVERQNKKGRNDSANWEIIASVNPLPTVDSIAVLCHYVYMYTGGAHGGAEQQYINYSLTDNRELTLNDFIDLSRPQTALALRRCLTDAFIKKYEPEWGDLQDFRHYDLLPLTNNFYVCKDGLVFVYQEYEVGPYAMGMPSVVIPYPTLMLLSR